MLQEDIADAQVRVEQVYRGRADAHDDKCS